jgi:hypothetical protein
MTTETTCRRAPAFLVLLAIAPLLGGCFADRETTGSVYPTDLRDRHPIVLTNAPRVLDIFVQGRSGIDVRESGSAAPRVRRLPRSGAPPRGGFRSSATARSILVRPRPSGSASCAFKRRCPTGAACGRKTLALAMPIRAIATSRTGILAAPCSRTWPRRWPIRSISCAAGPRPRPTPPVASAISGRSGRAATRPRIIGRISRIRSARRSAIDGRGREQRDDRAHDRQ